jgi:hypothetical protein
MRSGCAGLPDARPYDLRHSFASLLLHEGRSVIEVARQLGHGADVLLGTYAHVIEELEDRPQLPAEDAIREAREAVFGASCTRSYTRAVLSRRHPPLRRQPRCVLCRAFRKRPDQDSNLGPTP